MSKKSIKEIMSSVDWSEVDMAEYLEDPDAWDDYESVQDLVYEMLDGIFGSVASQCGMAA